MLHFTNKYYNSALFMSFLMLHFISGSCLYIFVQSIVILQNNIRKITQLKMVCFYRVWACESTLSHVLPKHSLPCRFRNCKQNRVAESRQAYYCGIN